METWKTHSDWSCSAARSLLVALAWAAQEVRIDPDSLQTIFDQLDKPAPGHDRSCTICQTPDAKTIFESYLEDPKRWILQAKNMYGSAQ